jgi:hypothetical protein
VTDRATAQRIPTAGVHLDADLAIPDQTRGVVLFAHGSGSSRHSPHNRGVADLLNHHQHATVLADLDAGCRLGDCRSGLDASAEQTTHRSPTRGSPTPAARRSGLLH